MFGTGHRDIDLPQVLATGLLMGLVDGVLPRLRHRRRQVDAGVTFGAEQDRPLVAPVGGCPCVPSERQQHMAVLQAFARMDRLDAYGIGIAFEALRALLIGDLGFGAQPRGERGRTAAGAALLRVHELEEMPQIGGVTLPARQRKHTRQHAEIEDFAIEDARETPARPACRGVVQASGPGLPTLTALIGGSERPGEFIRGPTEERCHHRSARLTVATACGDGIEPSREPTRGLGGEDGVARRGDGRHADIAQRTLQSRRLRVAVDEHGESARLRHPWRGAIARGR